MSDQTDLAAGEAGWRVSNDGEPVPGYALDQIAVGGGPQDAVVTDQRIHDRAVTEPPQPPTGQQHDSAGSLGRAGPPAPSPRACGHGLSQFPWDVKGGTLGDHVEPSVEADLW